jgi:hypothetical protein
MRQSFPTPDQEFNRLVLEIVFWMLLILTIALVLAGTFH